MESTTLHADWLDEGDALTRDFTFSNFKQAMSFAQKVGDIAEELNHHPDIIIHDYKHVSLIVRTHDTQSVTQKDQELALRIDDIT